MEKWKVIEFNTKFEVSNFGSVRNAETKQLKSLRFSQAGRLRVTLYKVGDSSSDKNKRGKTYMIHRLVAEAFIPKVCGKTHINHKDGVKTNNNVSNLEWCTVAENNAHSIANGLQKPQLGSDNGTAKLTEDIVRKIRYELSDMKGSELADMFNISRAVIYRIKNNQSWKHV